MRAPQAGRGYLERYRDCSEAMKTAVSDLFEQASELGWTHDEIATALINLAAEFYPDRGLSGLSANLASVGVH